MLVWMKACWHRWIMERAFATLRSGATWSQVRGPGTVPLPWAGPAGEIVLVTLNERGKMTKLPVVCATPREAMRAMDMPDPVFAWRANTPPPSSMVS